MVGHQKVCHNCYEPIYHTCINSIFMLSQVYENRLIAAKHLNILSCQNK